jgi:Ala-tRNA(Pro) deacylase
MHGVEAVTHFLDRQRARYELIEHTETFAAADEATAAGSVPTRMAKTVLLHDHDGFRAAIVPASERLDLHKARALFGASGHLRLASEDEIEGEFPVFDAGALPPFSALLGIPEILDTRLLDHDHVLCSGGDHRHMLKISPREIEQLGEPLVGEVCIGTPSDPLRIPPPAHQRRETQCQPQPSQPRARVRRPRRVPVPRTTSAGSIT